MVVVDDLSTGSLDNLRQVRAHPRLRLIQARVSACAELGPLVAEAETIYHLAAAVGVELVVRSPIHVLETNLHETEVLLEAAAGRRVPVLLASTSEVYGKSQKEAFAEEDDLLIGPPHQARWSYACSKLMDEFLALAYAKERSLPVVIARLFNTVGPRQTGQYGMVLPRFIAAARSGQTAQGLWGWPADAVLLLRARHRRSPGAPGELSGGARPGVQRRQHGGDRHWRPGRDGDQNPALELND